MDDVIREMLEPERPEPGAVARRRRFIATTAIIGLAVAGVTGLTTSALFTNTDSAGQSGFVSGTIDITPAATDFTVEAGNAAPGDTFYAPVNVSNSGTLQLRYATELKASDESDAVILPYLTFTVFAEVTPENCAAGVVPSSSIGSAVLGHNTHWIGSSQPGEQSGDRQLDATRAESLCIALKLSEEAGNDVQNTKAGLTLTFHAEQTANNP